MNTKLLNRHKPVQILDYDIKKRPDNKSSFIFIVKPEYHFFLEKKGSRKVPKQDMFFKEKGEMSPFQSLKSLKPGPKAF
jgi:hypothetical protein